MLNFLGTSVQTTFWPKIPYKHWELLSHETFVQPMYTRYSSIWSDNAAHRPIVHTNPSSGDPEISPITDKAIDAFLGAAAGTLVSSGQPHFMDLDLVRIAFPAEGEIRVEKSAVTASLVRLVEQGKLIPFVAPIIVRTLMRGPHRIRPRPSSHAGQVLTAIDDNGSITEPRLLQLVKRRNTLITFTASDEHWF